uniref:Uncharacterized protein n=1 Tax=Rhizophora mucronata TaxID=61149 RepID=A0A2P2Q8W2_RHIMU
MMMMMMMFAFLVMVKRNLSPFVVLAIASVVLSWVC